MPLFIVRRELPQVGEDDLHAGIMRAVSCSYNFQGMRWVTTYWDEGAGLAYCVYEAASADQLREHADLARVPCDDVWPIKEIGRDQLLSAPGALESASDAIGVERLT
jgi:hypothetical protein